MRLTRCRSIAAVSAALLLAGASDAARRPRFGGELRIETRETLPSPDPAKWPATTGNRAFAQALVGQVFETLVRVDEHGEVQPWLATNWTHDATHKHWVFAARAGVLLHDGAPWIPPGGAVSIVDDKPIEQILLDLARPANAIVVRGADGTLLGTGPFQIARWEPGRSARLVAFDSYWRGRPFLDAVEVQMGRRIRDQLLDLELGKADAAEVEVTDVRRLQQHGVSVEISKPAGTVALIIENQRVPVAAREALALSIDRGPIQRVLFDRQGEISAALLPQWLSGYAFLFRSTRDLVRAKALSSGQPPLKLAFDHDDALMRSVAERIAVNAGEAGITLTTVNSAPDVKLVRIPLLSLNADQALEEFASALGATADRTATQYERERHLLAEFRVIPLFHLPSIYAVENHVKNWTALGRLDDVWLEAR